jgi:putative selenate reductase molybdopterin-binding subunit
LVSSRTRHPIRTRTRLGAKKDGTITALGMDCLSNTGAYGSHALTVVCNCGSKMLPLYRAKNIHFTGTAVYTNLPVGGAYRGYGATQSSFAVECAMDELAEKLGMDPLDLPPA